MDRIEAHRAIATLHSFRFFGPIFIFPELLAPICRPDPAPFAAYWDLATGILAMLALLTVRIPSSLLAVSRRFQRRGSQWILFLTTTTPSRAAFLRSQASYALAT